MLPTFNIYIMKKLTLILLVFCVFTIKAQTNLVPNPSFEDTSAPILSSLLGLNDWSIANNNNNNNNNWGSPDYFNAGYNPSNSGVPFNLPGHQHPRTGNAYTGLWTYHSCCPSIPHREYITGELSQPLKEGKCYKVSFYFSPAGGFKGLVQTNIGLQFSNTPLSSNNHIIPYNSAYTVLDTNCIDSINYADWIEVTGNYIANGGEEFVTIGVFGPEDSTYFVNPGAFSGYSYIDDVSVIECLTTYNCIENTCISPGDSSGVYTTLSDCQTTCGVSAIEESNSTKQLLKITDVLGRESKPTPNVPLFYIYDDGTVEKKLIIE
jgi:OOP family OmpA-OmpF porin